MTSQNTSFNIGLLWLILMSTVIGFQNDLSACCSAHQLRYFPVGFEGEKLVVVEARLYRYCSDEGHNSNKDEFYFGWRGIISLGYYRDTFELVAVSDTVDFVSCLCDYEEYNDKEDYTDSLLYYFQKAEQLIDNTFSIEKLEMKNYAYNKDTTHYLKNIELDLNDTITTFIVDQKRHTKSATNWLAMGELEKIQEVKEYASAITKVYVVSLGYKEYKILPSDKIKANRKKFENKNNPVTLLPVNWHGGFMDYVLILHN